MFCDDLEGGMGGWRDAQEGGDLYVCTHTHTHTHTHTRASHMTEATSHAWASQVALVVKNPPGNAGDASHSSILAWRNPWKEEPGGLQSMGSQSVRHN